MGTPPPIDQPGVDVFLGFPDGVHHEPIFYSNWGHLHMGYAWGKLGCMHTHTYVYLHAYIYIYIFIYYTYTHVYACLGRRVTLCLCRKLSFVLLTSEAVG